ncbi:senescence-specific cysteine protease SAG39-like protein [Tanacetum coccineum]|uniref:Senescence-specific cysteine protease SAG39-like protein n=1 Tax=Tanacetum coccineum TaxID=301880 RepID=A0ABQ4Z473_9ASTR
MRFKIFKENVAYIEDFNSEHLAYKLSINKFADQKKEEFIATHTGFRVPSKLRLAQNMKFRYDSVTGIPSSMDWRQKGAVTPVKAQGQCGINTEAAYPYQGQGSNRTCNTIKEAVHAATISGYEIVPANNESALLKAVAMQPVSVTFDASNFRFYSSGVFSGTCDTRLNHAVTAVGYGCGHNLDIAPATYVINKSPRAKLVR